MNEYFSSTPIKSLVVHILQKCYILHHYSHVMYCVCGAVTHSYLMHSEYRSVAIYECILHTDIVAQNHPASMFKERPIKKQNKDGVYDHPYKSHLEFSNVFRLRIKLWSQE